MADETMRFRRRRLAILSVACGVLGLPFVLVSHRGAVPFNIGATLIGIASGVLAVALLLPALNRISR
jgi:hypothetical protein